MWEVTLRKNINKNENKLNMRRILVIHILIVELNRRNKTRNCHRFFRGFFSFLSQFSLFLFQK